MGGALIIREYISIADAISTMAGRDCVLVLPTLEHAVDYKRRLKECLFDRFNPAGLVVTHSALVSKDTQTMLRLWVPYEREPTMPMDSPEYRLARYTYMTPYNRHEIRKALR